MSKDIEKYTNWRAITESDYVTMFIKTWFAFVATLRDLSPDEKVLRKRVNHVAIDLLQIIIKNTIFSYSLRSRQVQVLPHIINNGATQKSCTVVWCG